MTIDVANTLEKARSLVEAGWIQGHMSATELRDNEYVDCYCASGALYEAVLSLPGRISDLVMPLRAALRNALADLGVDTSDDEDAATDGLPDIVVWNDAEGRTQEEVLAAFDRAIEMVSA